MASVETIITHPVQPDEMLVPLERDEAFAPLVKVNIKYSEKPSSKRAVLFCGGWAASARALDRASDVLVELGRDTITFEQDARLGDSAAEQGFSAHHNRKANTILTVARQCNLTQISAIAYSESAISTLLAARQCPELFKSIVLVNGAGLVGIKSFGYFVARSGLCIGRDARRVQHDTRSLTHSGLALYDGVRYVLRSPRTALGEVRAISRAELGELVSDVRVRGVKVGAIISNKDPFFPAKEIMSHGAAGLDAIASFRSKHAGHNELVVRPELAAIAAEQMVCSLEEVA